VADVLSLRNLWAWIAEPTPGTKTVGWRQHALILVLLLLVFVGLRASFLTADPPLKLPNGKRSYELIMEGAAKAQEARHKALFGSWAPNPADNYQFWRMQSPAWVYPLAGFFKICGPSFASLRAFSVIGATLGFGALLTLMARKARGWPLAVGGLLVAGMFYDIHYSRAGLLEPQVNALLTISVLCALTALRDIRWSYAAQWSLVLALLTKQSALVLVPLAGVVLLAAQIRAFRQAGVQIRTLGPIVHAVALALSLLLYVRTDAYWRTVTWNFSHVFLKREKHSEVDVGLIPWESVADRLRSFSDSWQSLSEIFAVLGWLAALELARLVVQAVRRRVDAWDLVVLGWFASAYVAVQFTAQNDVRFKLILFPPVFLLAFGFVAALWRTKSVRRRGVSMALATGLIGYFVFVHGPWQWTWWQERRYVGIELNRAVERSIGDRAAVLIGAWAVPASFDTRYQAYFVKGPFNSSRKALATLAPTHFAWRSRGDWTRRVVQKNFRSIRRLRPSRRLRAWGPYWIELVEVPPSFWKAHSGV
jgi:hypothetical protein